MPNSFATQSEPLSTTRARNGDIQTAREAAQKAVRTAGSTSWKIVRAMEGVGAIGLTIEETAVMLGRKRSSVSPRFAGLVAAGFVVDSGRKRRHSGRPQAVYIAVQYAGVAMPEDAPAPIIVPPKAGDGISAKEITASLDRYVLSMGSYGSTIGEAALALCVDETRISSMFRHLERDGVFRETALKRTNRAGNQTRVWVHAQLRRPGTIGGGR